MGAELFRDGGRGPRRDRWHQCGNPGRLPAQRRQETHHQAAEEGANERGQEAATCWRLGQRMNAQSLVWISMRSTTVASKGDQLYPTSSKYMQFINIMTYE